MTIIKRYLLLSGFLLPFGGIAFAAIGTGPGGNFIQNRNTLQPSATMYISSGTILNLRVGTITFVGDGTNMHTAAIGGGSSTTVRVTLSGVSISSPALIINFSSNGFTASDSPTGTSNIGLNTSATYWILNRSPLQSGAVFNVSSGSVQGPFATQNGSLRVSLTPSATNAFQLINTSSEAIFMQIFSSGTARWRFGNDVKGLGNRRLELFNEATGNIVLYISTSDLTTFNQNINLANLTASKPLHTDATKNIVAAPIDLTSDVTGILPSGNLPTNIDYINVAQTISATKIFTSSETFTNLLIAQSTFVITGSTFVINGTTYNWQAGSGSNGNALLTNGAAQPTLTFGSPSASITPGNTNYIQNVIATNSPQSSSAFWTSSGSVSGPLTLRGALIQFSTGPSGETNLFTSTMTSNTDVPASVKVFYFQTDDGLAGNGGMYLQVSTKPYSPSQVGTGPPESALFSLNRGVSGLSSPSARFDIGGFGSVILISSTTAKFQDTIQNTTLSASQFVKTDGSKNLVSATIAKTDLPSNVAFTDSTQTFTGGNTFASSTTFNGTINISSGVLLNGAAGNNGQVFTSGGAGTIPSWTTVSGSGGSSVLAVATGTSAGFTGLISSPTAVLNFSSTTFKGQLSGGATAFIDVNPSSVTLGGVLKAGANISLNASNGSTTINVTGLSSGNTNYINNTTTLQSPASYYINGRGVFEDAYGTAERPQLLFRNTSANSPSNRLDLAWYFLNINGVDQETGRITNLDAVGDSGIMHFDVANTAASMVEYFRLSGANSDVEIEQPLNMESLKISNIGTTNSNFDTGGALTVNSTFTVTNSTVIINGITYHFPSAQSSNFLKNDGSGNLTWTAAGSGGASTLAVATGTSSGFAGAIISSPTAIINFSSSVFKAQLTGGATAFIDINASSVTEQGNTFNGNNQLLQLDATGLIPNANIDGSSITKMGVLVAGSNITIAQGVGVTTITASSGGSALTTATGSATGFTGFFSSNTTTIVLDSNTFSGQLTGGSTFFVSLKNSGVAYASATITSDQTGIGTTFTTITGSTLSLNIKVNNDPAEVCFGFTFDENAVGGGRGVWDVLVDNVSQGAGTNGGVMTVLDGIASSANGMSDCIMTGKLSSGVHNIYLQAKDASSSTVDLKCATSKCYATAFEIGGAVGTGTGSTSPGGSDTQIQYNNNSTFAGIANHTTDGINIKESSGTLTVDGTGYFKTQDFYWNAINAVTVSYTITSTDSIVTSSCGVNTSCTITLPAASSNKGLDLTIYKTDVDTQTLTINPNGSDLINTSTQVVLMAPFSPLHIISNGTLWVTPKIPHAKSFVGCPADSNTGAALVANSAVCEWFDIDEPQMMKGMAFNITATSNTGHTDVGVFDQYGNVISTAGSTANQSSTNGKSMNFVTAAYLPTGLYIQCIAVDNAVVNFTRQSTVSGWGQFTNSSAFPLPAKLTLPGTANTSAQPKVLGYFYGGATQ